MPIHWNVPAKAPLAPPAKPAPAATPKPKVQKNELSFDDLIERLKEQMPIGMQMQIDIEKGASFLRLWGPDGAPISGTGEAKQAFALQSIAEAKLVRAEWDKKHPKKKKATEG